MADLEQIFNGEYEEPAEVETPEPMQEEAQSPEPAEVADNEPPQAEPEKEPETVPLATFLELKSKIKELQADRSQPAQPQPEPQKTPDVFENPEAYTRHIERAVQQAATNSQLKLSRFLAERDYGKETVEQAFAYFNDHPEQSTALLKHESPFHAAVEHFNKQKVAEEIGSDPEGWMRARKEEIRKEVEAELVAKQVKEVAGKPAPSMANVTGTGGGPKANWTGPTPLNALFGE